MFEYVRKFESEIAEFYGSPYAVAVDSCTHAIELCLRYTQANSVQCPRHTYPSIPMTFMKLGLDWSWQDLQWNDQYTINGTNIVDGAFLFEENSYVPKTFLCLSFQFQKPIKLGRGGAILLDNKKDAEILRLMAHDGRDESIFPWREQNIKYLGYHYYMTPETAQEGSKKLVEARNKQHKSWGWRDYPDISSMEVFCGSNQ